MDKRQALLEEKRRLLVWKLQVVAGNVESGVSPKRDLLLPQIAIAEVDAERARDKAGRLAALRRIVTYRHDLEQAASAEYQANTTDRVALVEAQIARINAELALEEATRRKP